MLSSSFGDPAGIRTPDPQLRRLLLYPAELRDHHISQIRLQCCERFSQIRVQRYYFFLKCANFLFLFFFACAQGLRGKKPKKHPSRRIVTLSGPLAVAVSLCNCKQAFIAPTAITITYQGRPIQRRAKTPARAQCRPKKQLLRTKTKTKTKTFYVSQQYSRTRNMFFKFGTN